MTARAETPLQQLLASGLHRLAQPVSSAMWALELAKEPSLAPLPHLASEMRRAAGILHAMRGVMEAGSTYQDLKPEWVDDLVQGVHQQSDAELRRSGIVCEPLQSAVRIRSNLDARGVVTAYRLLLEKFLQSDLAPATVHVSLMSKGAGFILTLNCDSPLLAAWTEAQRSRLLQELDPFEIPGFDFSANVAPELTQARAILGASSIFLSASVDASAMRFQMQGAQFIH